jgi:hypothetical protein
MTTTTEVEPQAPAKPSKAVKPITVDLTSQFCLNANPDMHTHCKGSGENGDAAHFWFCQCDCHVEQPTCRNCGARNVEVTLEGTCVDVDGCLTTQGVRRASNPIHQQLRDIIDAAEERQAEAAAARKAARVAQHAAEVAKAKAEGRPAPVARVRIPKAPPTPQRCHCGCAGMTKGGKFVAGHDARLKGMLVRAARQTKPDTGKPATKAQAINAMAELISRDWPRKGVDAEITRQADAMFNQYGPDPLIQAAVEARYGKSK